MKVRQFIVGLADGEVAAHDLLASMTNELKAKQIYCIKDRVCRLKIRISQLRWSWKFWHKPIWETKSLVRIVLFK